MENSSIIYFSCHSRLLNPHTLEYCWFGVAWREEEIQMVIIGYWFANQQEDLLQIATCSAGSPYEAIHNPKQVLYLYHLIRQKQKEEDWNKQSLLPLKTGFSKIWRAKSNGYYLVRSRASYPCYVFTIKKKWFTLWLTHSDVIETKQELQSYLEKVNREHNIALKQEGWSSPCSNAYDESKRRYQ